MEYIYHLGKLYAKDGQKVYKTSYCRTKRSTVVVNKTTDVSNIINQIIKKEKTHSVTNVILLTKEQVLKRLDVEKIVIQKSNIEKE